MRKDHVHPSSGTGSRYWALLFCLLGLPLILEAQKAASGVVLRGAGTGRTTGHIITLFVTNPTAQPVRLEIGPCFVPSRGRGQAYVVSDAYTLDIPPLGTLRQPLHGYCANVDRPPVHAGEATAPVESWVSWQEGAPIPEAGTVLTAPFQPRAVPTPEDGLTWPGTRMPFPYTLDINRHPVAAARFLLHYIRVITEAVDGLHQQGRLPRWPAEREAIIQQTFWHIVSQLEGRRHDLDFFRQGYVEQWREVRNETDTPAPDAVLGEAEDFWSAITLVGAEAKVLPVLPVPLPGETPPGPGGTPLNMRAGAEGILATAGPGSEATGEQLSPLIHFLHPRREEPAWAGLWSRTQDHWRSWFETQLATVNTDASGALEILLGLSGILESDGRIGLPVADVNRLVADVSRRLDEHVRSRVRALRTDDPAFIEKWRRLHAWQDADWYAGCCQATRSLGDLPTDIGGDLTPRRGGQTVPLTGPGWKIPAVPFVPATKRFPWWIPAVGVPVAGTATWLLLREGDDGPGTPDLPVAVTDDVTLTCPGEIVVSVLINDTGAGIRLVYVHAPTGVGVQAIPTGEVLVTAAGAGTFMATYIIRDSLGRQAQGDIRITVLDLEAPLVICPPDAEVPQGSAHDPSVTGTPQVEDMCVPASQLTTAHSDTQEGGSCAPVVRIWTVSDPSGNSASCAQTIVLTDEMPPGIQCPGEVILPAGETPDPGQTGMPATSDNCTPESSIQVTYTDVSEGAGCEAVISRTWMAVDQIGNSSTCLQTIRFVDETPPEISCPPGLDAECATYGNTGLTGVATATDNCTAGVPVTHADVPVLFSGCEGQVVRTWAAVDEAGLTATCIQVLQVSDAIPPVFTSCPASVTVAYGDENNLDVTGSAQAVDQCQPDSMAGISHKDDLGNWSDCGGVIVRQWTATDPCGNSNTGCIQMVTAFSEKPPTIQCPADTVTECGEQADIGVTGAAQAADACGDSLTATWSDQPWTFDGCTGTIERIWTATDGGGKTATCVQQIKVEDTTPPVFEVCPPAVTVECGQHQDPEFTGIPEVTDACQDMATFSFKDDPEVVVDCEVVVTRTFTAQDPCGHTAVCQQQILVRDQTPPVIMCPDQVTVQCGQQNNLNVTGEAMATDGCHPVADVGHVDDFSGFSGCEGIIIRTFFAVDACGNVSTCIQSIQVENVPCPFVPVFATAADVCGRCTGTVDVFVAEPGNYTYAWENGASGPSVSGLCAGSIMVTITDEDIGCSDIYVVDIPASSELPLVVLDVVHPSDFSASDGSVTLQVNSPAAILPFHVFVNGVMIGSAIANPFQIVGMPVGEYTIQIRDDNGEGCFSNEVFVLLFVSGKPAPPQVGIPLMAIPDPLLPDLPAGPEHPALSAQTFPSAGWQSGGATVWWPVSRRWQSRLEMHAFRGRADGVSAAGIPVGVSLQGHRLTGGWRYTWPVAGGIALFQETGLGLQDLRVIHGGGSETFHHGVADLSGGLQWRWSDHVRLEATGRWSLLIGPGGGFRGLRASAGLICILPDELRPSMRGAGKGNIRLAPVIPGAGAPGF